MMRRGECVIFVFTYGVYSAVDGIKPSCMWCVPTSIFIDTSWFRTVQREPVVRTMRSSRHFVQPMKLILALESSDSFVRMGRNRSREPHLMEHLDHDLQLVGER